MSTIYGDRAAAVKASTDILAVISRDVQLKREGDLYIGRCPFHTENSPSFKVYTDPGDPHYHCYGCGEHGDVFEFMMKRETRTFKDVLDELASAAHIIPDSVPYRPQEHAGNGHTNGNGHKSQEHGPTIKWTPYTYSSAEGAAFVKVRLDYEDGEKDFRWYTEAGYKASPRRAGLDGAHIEDMQLYGHQDVMAAPEDEGVIFAEGEKARGALRDHGFLSVCHAGGASTKKFGTSLEVLRGRRVYLWPDNDDDGRKFMACVAAALHGIAAEVYNLDLYHADIREKDDAFDYLARFSADNVRTAFENACPTYTPKTGQAFSHPANMLGLETLDALLSAPAEPVEMLVDKLIVKVGSSLWAARPKVGKSTALRTYAFDLAMSGQTVVYLALEESRQDVVDHFRRLYSSEHGPGGENLLVLIGPAPEDGLAFLRSIVENHRPALVVVDPQQRLTKVKDLNDYAQVYNVLSSYTDYARGQGFHLALTHHLNKLGDDDEVSIMGSTAVYAVVDCAFLIHKKRDGARTIKTDGAQRGGVNLPETVLSYDDVTGRSELAGSLAESELAETQGKILDSLTERGFDANGNEVLEYPELDETEIRARVGGRVVATSRALRALADRLDFRVIRTGGGKKNDPYLYRRNPHNHGPKVE